MIHARKGEDDGVEKFIGLVMFVGTMTFFGGWKIHELISRSIGWTPVFWGIGGLVVLSLTFQFLRSLFTK